MVSKFDAEQVWRRAGVTQSRCNGEQVQDTADSEFVTYGSDAVIVVDERLWHFEDAILNHLLQAQAETAQQPVHKKIVHKHSLFRTRARA